LGALWLDVDRALAHGANFKDPSDDPKRSARPSPIAPAPPDVVTESARGLPAVWKPEGWYRWWELNAVALTPRRRTRPRTPQPSVTTPLPTKPAAAPARDVERAKLVAALMKLAEPGAKTERRLLASALVTLGRLAEDERPLFLLKRWAINRSAGAPIRNAALLGLGLLRRDEPSARIAAVHLRTLRRFLLERADDTEEPVRTRAYAIFSLGLLADQGHEDTTLTRDGRDITHAIWQRLPHGHTSTEISSALLTALGMQPPAGVPIGVVDGLKAIALGKRVRGRAWDPYESSHAISALARLGKPGTDAFLLRLVVNTRRHPALRAATAIALMRRAPAMAAPARIVAMRALEKTSAAPGTPWLVSALESMAVGTLLGAEMRGACGMTEEKKAMGRRLRVACLDGRREVRPFAALAVALAGHGLRESSDDLADLLFFSRRALRWGLEDGGRSDRMLGAYAIGLGLLRDTEGRRILHKDLKERERDGVLRGHCALALGLIGPRDLTLTTALFAATRERTHIFLHLQAARALGILDVPDALDKLKRRFDAADTPSVTSGLALGLATLGDRGAFASLFARLADKERSTGVRVNCLLALGAILDPEPGSSAARMTVHANYTALTGAHRRYLDLL